MADQKVVSRPEIAGPDHGPEPPFPIRLSGPIIKGFGRGSSELGIPTANIPIAGLSVGGHEDIESGVYYGWCGVSVDDHGDSIKFGDDQGQTGTVWEMVMSIGWNPVYQNKARSVEVHIMHDFDHDFYGARMNLIILGFIRPELDYVSKEKLIEDIRIDIKVAKQSLARTSYSSFKGDGYLLDFTGIDHQNEVAT